MENETCSISGGLSYNWRRWTRTSINRGIFGAALTVGTFTIVAKFASVFKELVVAKVFGTSDALDAFLLAFLLPSFAITVIAGSINSAVVPVVVRVREMDGQSKAQHLLGNITVVNLCGLTVLGVLFAPLGAMALPFIASGFPSEKLLLTRSLLFLLLPVLLIYGVSSTWSAVLNARQQFALPSLAPAITPLLTLAIVLCFHLKWAVYSVVAGTLIGSVGEALFLAWALKRSGFSPWPSWHGLDQPTREVLRQFVPLCAGAFLMSSSTLIDQAMAASLGPGSVSALNYGNKIVSFIIGVGSTAIGTAVLPYFAKLISAADWRNTRHTFWTYVRLFAWITVPLTIVLVAGAKPLTRILFERGNFNANDTSLVSSIMICFVLQLPFYLTGIIGVRLLNAFNQGKTILWISIVNMIANVVGNLLLMRWMGVAGIALSTSVVYLISSSLIFKAVSREFKARSA